MTIPVLAGHAPGAPLFVRVQAGATVTYTAAQCMGAAAMLAAALPPARHAIQCCTDTLDLALSTLAAWHAGQTVVMPSTRLAADVDALRARYPDHHVMDAHTLRQALPAALHATAAPAAAWLDAAPSQWPPFTLDGAFEAIVLFTSGTTRAPRAHAKTWDALVRGAATFGEAYPPLAQRPLLAGTVDCHHMFGLEANLVAALRCGYPLCTERPQFPADVAALLANAALRALGPLWLVTTPLQLANFHAALGVVHAAPERIIVATMPLAPGLAVAVERDWHTVVGEIFGNTEVGVMATRRPAVTAAYTPAPGMTFVFGDDDAVAVARAPDVPAPLDDRVQPVPGAVPAAFLLLGRRSDMIKVAGKRTTLATLNDHLRSIPGVVDAAFAMGAGARLLAAVVAPGVTRAAVLHALGERIDAAFMPRPLVLVQRLPRDANGKLPRAALMACVADALAGAGSATVRAGAPAAGTQPPAERDVLTRIHAFAPTHPAFAGHFPGDPVVPGALLLAEVEALLRAHGHVVAACEQAKFLAPVRPAQACTLRVDCARLPQAAFEVCVRDVVHARGLLRCAMPAVAAP